MRYRNSRPSRASGQSGFTLIEAVIVIVITGIIAAMVAIFIRAPIQGYVDSARRAELTDIANTAVRRISRDLHLALPNSVRIFNGSTGTSVEFLQTRSGGRYRVDASAGGGDPLDFGKPDATSGFDILGAAIVFQPGDSIAIYNLGIPGTDAYNGDNLRAYNGTTGGAGVSNVLFTPNTPFPFDSLGHRFQVVEGPVTYRCDPAAGTLRRYSGYAPTPAQVDIPAGAGVISPLLANNISACLFTYQPINQRFGLLSIRLTLTESGETVSLYSDVHVNNVP